MRTIAVIGLAFIVTNVSPERAAAQSIDQMYRQAVEARAAGDVTTAISRLEEIVARVPDHVDALFLLGSLYGIEDRLGEAEATLKQALALAPDYTDLKLALARVTAWRGDNSAAAAIVDQVLALHPDHIAALNLWALLAYYTGDLDRSEAGYRRVLDREPENVEALLGLGDVEAAREEFPAAEQFYRRAAALDPRSPEVQERLRRKHPRVFKWRFDANGSYSWFSRQSRSAWRESFTQLSYRLSKKTMVHGRLEVSERFDQVDAFLQAGVHHRPLDWLGGYLKAGGTPSAHFRERLTASGGGTMRLWKGGEGLGATVLTLDGKWAKYGAGNVVTVKPGLQQYFLAGRLWFSGQWINIIDETDTHVQGWLGKADAQVLDRVRLFAGAAKAPETVRNISVQTFSVFGGMVIDLSEQLGLRVDYARDDRENSFIRHSIVLGLFVRF